MKKIIISKPIRKIKALFGNIDEFIPRYSQIEKVFGDDPRCKLFAEPVIVPEKMEISWFTDIDGDFKSFNVLTQEQQYLTLGLLTEKMEDLREKTKELTEASAKNVVQNLETYFEIPDKSCIYGKVDGDSVSDVLLIEWGCISEAFDSEKGLISKMIPANRYPMRFQVLYTDGDVAPSQPVTFNILGETFEATSDDNGYIDLGDYKVYTVVRAIPSAMLDTDKMKRFICFADEVKILKLEKIPIMKFRVVNENHQPIPNIPIKFELGGDVREIVSNGEGKISIANIEKSSGLKSYTLEENNTKKNIHDFSFEDEMAEYLIVIKGVPVNFCVKVIMKKEKIVPEAKVRLSVNDQKLEKITDENGLVYFSNVALNDNAKVKASKKRRRGKRKFDFKDPNVVHIVKIRKPISLWWLLLLLLPLLLLIQWEKEVQFQVVNDFNGKNVVDANVNFNYLEREAYSFYSRKFFTGDFIQRKEKTDANGIAKFPGVKVTLYSWLFYHNDYTNVIAYADCFGSDTLSPASSELKNKTPYQIRIGHLKHDFIFKVINSKNREPIPDADVTLTSDANGTTNTFTAKSGVDGNAVFIGVPVCANLTIKAKAYGYKDNTIKVKGQDVFYSGKNTVPLDPLTEAVVFYVKNLRNKQPIPGATANLIIDGKTVQTTRTNINGAVSMIGSGSFSNVHVIKSMTIKTTKQDYSDTTLSAKVSVFIKTGAAQRTLYLRAKAQSVTFKTVDASDGKILAGVEVVLTVHGKTKKEYSNSAGSVTFADLYPGDLVSIKANKNPKYYENKFAFSEDIGAFMNGSAADNTIKMMPKALPPPPPPPPDAKPCNGGSDATHANSRDVSQKFNMGKDSGVFQFNYYTDSAPDRMIIYCKGQKIFEYYGATKKRTFNETISFNDPIITVRVLGGTKWRYTVNCP